MTTTKWYYNNGNDITLTTEDMLKKDLLLDKGI